MLGVGALVAAAAATRKQPSAGILTPARVVGRRHARACWRLMSGPVERAADWGMHICALLSQLVSAGVGRPRAGLCASAERALCAPGLNAQ